MVIKSKSFSFFSVIKTILFISLALMIQKSIATLEVSKFNDNQICMFATYPPLPAQITFEIEARGIECDNDEITTMSESLISKGSPRLNKLKRWNKMLRGKGPIYSTTSGTNIEIDTFGDEKSIKIKKIF